MIVMSRYDDLVDDPIQADVYEGIVDKPSTTHQLTPAFSTSIPTIIFFLTIPY